MRCEKGAGSVRQGLCVYSGLASNIPFYQQSKFPRWPLGPALNVCCLLELMDLRRSAAGGGKTAYASVRRTEGEVDGKVQEVTDGNVCVCLESVCENKIC